MAHFAEIDSENKVIQVIVVSNDDCEGGDFPGSEASGVAFCNNLLGGTWKQTSYNNNFRKNYAGIGYSYDPDLDAFIPPKPYESWVLDTETCRWNPPVPRPEGDAVYVWDEESISWVVKTPE